MSIGEVEKQMVLDLMPLLSDKPVVFDVGSNKGNWSDIVMSTNDKCTFHFFEPNEIMINYTKIKYDYNTNIIYNEVAISDKEGYEDFYYFTNFNNGLSSILYNEKWKDLPMQKKLVNSITLDSYCSKNLIDSIDILKIDIEGADYKALLGLEQMLLWSKVKFIQIESSEHYKLDNRTFKDVIEFVGSYGYDVYSYDGIFHKVEADTFIEDSRLENFIITKEKIANTQNWNTSFIKNTEGLPKVCFALEVGCFEGMTTKYICENMLTEEGHMIAVDPLEDKYIVENITDEAVEINDSLPYFEGQYTRFLINTNKKPVRLVRKTFTDAFSELEAFRFSFIYIDADHRADSVYLDAKMAFELLQTDGYILFDDYEWGNGETKKGIDRFLDEYKDRVDIISINEQVLVKYKFR